MQQKRRIEKDRQSIGIGLGVGIVISFAISLLLAAGLALLVVNEHIGIEKMNYFSLGILFTAVLAGAYTAAKITMKKPALVCGIVAGTYLFVLIAMNVLFIESGFTGMWGCLVSIILGWVSACALCISKPRKTNYRKVRNR